MIGFDLNTLLLISFLNTGYFGILILEHSQYLFSIWLYPVRYDGKLVSCCDCIFYVRTNSNIILLHNQITNRYE
jgi:hypothetical protein